MFKSLDAQSIIKRFKSLIKEWTSDPQNNIDSRIKAFETKLNLLDKDHNSSREALAMKDDLIR